MKKKWMLPTLLIVLAVGATFATIKDNEGSSTDINGYSNLFNVPCGLITECTTNGGLVCKDIFEVQAFALDISGITCPVQVYARPFY